MVPTNPSQRSVVVIGGGLAGIAASLALAQHGVQVTLVEARRRLGGRTGSFAVTAAEEKEQPTEAIDYCQHVAMGCCTNLRQLIDWLGQTEYWLEHKELHFVSQQGQYQRLRALPLLPAPLHIGHWLIGWPNLSWLDRLAIARGLLAMWRLPLSDQLDAIPALTWLRQHGQTQGSLQHFWSTIMVSALGAELEAVNLAAATKVIQDGFLNHREAFHVLVPQQPLDELFNRQAYQRLQEAGVRVKLSTPAKQMIHSSQATYGDVECIEVVTSREVYRAHAAIVAVPWHALGRLAATSTSVRGLATVAEQSGRLTSSPITGIHTWWDQPWLQLPNVAIVGRLCQWVFAAPSEQPDRTHPSGYASEHYYQIVVSASRGLSQLSEQELQRQLIDELSELFPASRAAQLLRLKVVTDPQSVFSIKPGTIDLRPFASPLEAPILFAGDWTRTGWPATMEGAVLSGFRAAEAFLSRSGAPQPIVAPPLGQEQRRAKAPKRTTKEN